MGATAGGSVAREANGIAGLLARRADETNGLAFIDQTDDEHEHFAGGIRRILE
jgi:hypothetical protein